MTKKQFEKMLTPELLSKLRGIARGTLRNSSEAEDAVQTVLLRIFGRLREYRKLTPSFLASRVVMVCGERRKIRAANASLELPVGGIEDPDNELSQVEKAEYQRTHGRRTPRRRPSDLVPPPVDLENREREERGLPPL